MKRTAKKAMEASSGLELPPELAPGPGLGRRIRLFRVSLGLTQAQLARLTRVNRPNLSAYETGAKTPRPATLAKLASARPRPPKRPGDPAAAGTLADRVRAVADEALDQVAARLASDPEGHGFEAGRSFAGKLWLRLAPLPTRERRLLIDLSPPFHKWALVERLAHESERAAVRDAVEGLTLAELAFRAAEQLGCSPLGPAAREYAWMYLGNIFRVQGDHPAAAAAISASKGDTQAGGFSPFSRARILDREASFLRGQRRFDEAFSLHKQALEIARPHERGFLLLNLSATLQVAGRAEESVEALRRAVEALDGQVEDPDSQRHRWGARFNLAVNLLDLKRPAEAEELLPQVRALTGPEDDLDQLRLRWLEAKLIATKADRRDEAIDRLAEVRQGFADRNLGYDAALAAFEAAALLLDQGRTENARALIEVSLPTFVALKIRREGIASIGLYAETLRRDAETSAFAREMLNALDRSGFGGG